jgi:two-component system chemotaxis response regulator CheB
VIKVLVVDDSALARKLFVRFLAREPDMDVSFARSGREALARLADLKPDVVTLDINMPEMDGLDCLDRIMVERPCPVLMVSSLSSEGAETTLEALRLGAVDFISKPGGAVSLHMDAFGPELVAKVRNAANAKLRASLRLRERVLHRIGAATSLHTHKASDLPDAPRLASGPGVVVVGASTGGPPALEALLLPLPTAFPWPIVIAQHMPASFTGALARRLDRSCAIGVTEVDQPITLLAGHAYIGRGDADIVIARQGRSAIVSPERPAADYPWRPSADRLVRSAMARFAPSQIVGVLMTGMGNDGAGAMSSLRALGGRTIAEAEETAVVWGMPGELVKAGGATWILPVHKIAEKLQQVVGRAARSKSAR